MNAPIVCVGRGEEYESRTNLEGLEHLILMFYECIYCMCEERGRVCFSHILRCQFTLQQRIQGTIRVFLELISADLAAKKKGNSAGNHRNLNTYL